jgi:cutinase
MVVGDPLVARLKRDMPGANVRGYPVQYPASLVSSLTSAGPNDLKARIAAQSKECPDEKFALVGYSQGGMVVAQSLAGIPADLQSKVVAVVTYGAGDGSGINAAFKAKTLSNCAPGDFVSSLCLTMSI